MKKTMRRETKNETSSKKKGEVTKAARETERLTKDDLAALRTNLKGGGPVPARCCEFAPN